MPNRLIHHATRLAVIAGAGLALTAAPAVATEGPAGPQLPNTLAPVAIQPAPNSGAGTRTVTRRPRVTQARVSPRKVARGRRSRLRLSLATPGRVQVVLARTVRGRHIRVSVRTVAASGQTLSLRLPASLRSGQYRVSTVAIDAQGNRSRAVRRMLIVGR